MFPLMIEVYKGDLCSWKVCFDQKFQKEKKPVFQYFSKYIRNNSASIAYSVFVRFKSVLVFVA